MDDQDRSPDVPTAAEVFWHKEAKKILKAQLPTPEWKARHLSRCCKVHRQLVATIGRYTRRNDCDIIGGLIFSGDWRKIYYAERELRERINLLAPLRSGND